MDKTKAIKQILLVVVLVVTFAFVLHFCLAISDTELTPEANIIISMFFGAVVGALVFIE